MSSKPTTGKYINLGDLAVAAEAVWKRIDDQVDCVAEGSRYDNIVDALHSWARDLLSEATTQTDLEIILLHYITPDEILAELTAQGLLPAAPTDNPFRL